MCGSWSAAASRISRANRSTDSPAASWAQHLHDDVAAERLVACDEDAGHAAATELAVQRVSRAQRCLQPSLEGVGQVTEEGGKAPQTYAAGRAASQRARASAYDPVVTSSYATVSGSRALAWPNGPHASKPASGSRMASTSSRERPAATCRSTKVVNAPR